MAILSYIDETYIETEKGRQLLLVAAMVDEGQVQELGQEMRAVLVNHLGAEASAEEVHAFDLWHGNKIWAGMRPSELLNAYEAFVGLLGSRQVNIAHASINLERLYSNSVSPYQLALQFLAEKIDGLTGLKIVIADEAKEHELRAIENMSGMQESGCGEVVGKKLKSVIDGLHFVRSHQSRGVQMADLVAYLMGRRRRLANEGHPDADRRRQEMLGVIAERTVTWREPWPNVNLRS